MAEPGELTPARPPSATLTPALLTVTSAFDPVIKPEWPPKSKVPFAPTSPPSIAPETVPPSTVTAGGDIADGALIGAGEGADGLEGNTRLAVTSTFARFRLRTTPMGPMTPNSPTLWVVESFGAMVRLAMVWPWPSNTPVNIRDGREIRDRAGIDVPAQRVGAALIVPNVLQIVGGVHQHVGGEIAGDKWGIILRRARVARGIDDAVGRIDGRIEEDRGSAAR